MAYTIIQPHKRAKDLTGQTFGNVLALAPIGRTPNRAIIWLCICDTCTTEFTAIAQDLISGKYISCGCYRVTHGETRSTEHIAWSGMRLRCNNPNDPGYPRYGGRGISVCKRWDSFELFLEDMGRKPAHKDSIDRINNDGDYTPENCRWATHKQQCRNRRSNVFVTYKGESLCVSEWAERFGMNPATLGSRIATGWDIHDAFYTPVAH